MRLLLRATLAIAIYSQVVVEAGTVPHGVRASDWDQIFALYQKHRHALVSVAGDWRAKNPGQQWVAEFNARGVTVTPESGDWSWGLNLTGIAGQPVNTAAARTVEENRISYRHNQNVTEWFINDPTGLEHGFTLYRSPLETPGTFIVELAITGTLAASSTTQPSNVEFRRADGTPALRYHKLKVWDQRGHSLPAGMEVRGQQLLLSIDDRDAVYPITIDPWVQQAYLKASNAGANDWFGYSVAVWGDTVAVGAYQESSSAVGVNGNQASNSAPYSGAVYVFVRDGGTWRQQAYLKASNTDAEDFFGYSVALHGDTLAVGAWAEDSGTAGVNGNQANNSISGSGAAYVFVRNGTTWAQQAYLKASNPGEFDWFGSAVALSGNSLVVSAWGEDSRATTINGNQLDDSARLAGAAYVFVRDGNAWSQQAYLKASNAEAFDQFGTSVAISDNTIVVGAWLEDSDARQINGSQTNNAATGSGAAYIFVRNGVVWTQQAYLKASNSQEGDGFGSFVAIDGETIAVAAWQEDSSATGVNGIQSDNAAADSGAVYVFARSGGSWTQQAYIKSSNTQAQDTFGFSMALQRDTLVVGADGEDSRATGINGDQGNNGASRSGAAYVFTRTGGVWSQQAYVKASNTQADDYFGWRLALQNNTLIVGAHGEDATATSSGAAYVYTFSEPVSAGGLRFVPITPCRLLETRSVYAGTTWTGQYGPPALAAGQTRTVPIAGASRCGIPASAKAFVLNATIDTLYSNSGPVDFVTIWPADESRPDFWTLRTSTGGYIANSAIVRSGGGSIRIYSSNTTNLSLDISGYFTDDGTGLLFYPLDSCRPIDTRSNPTYTAGLAPPFGNRRMEAGETRSFRLPSSSRCAIPAAQAYSMQFTLTPGAEADGLPVAYLSAWNSGGGEPPVSNLNSYFGYVMANSSIVPARADGSIDVKTYNATNFLGDVNGYFGPDDGSGRGLLFFPVRQCRVMDTQDLTLSGDFGPPRLSPATDREIRLPLSSRCSGLPASAKAWAVNATLIPNGSPVAFLSLWEAGANWPAVSQMNAFQGQTVSNSAIVPGSANGGIAVKVSNATDAALEVAGYFSR